MAIPAGIRAVFFDAVGTLIHPAPPAPTVYAEAGRRFGDGTAPAEIARRFRQAFARAEEGDRADRWQTSEAREARRWRQIVAEVLPNVSEATACFAELFSHFGRPESWRAEPDAAAVVRTLADRGYALGLASNFDRRLRSVAAGLLPPWEHLVISSEIGWRKPAPEFFAALRRSTGLPAEQILYVGDDPANDYAGAREAGLAAMLFDPLEKHADLAAVRITRLTDLV